MSLLAFARRGNESTRGRSQSQAGPSASRRPGIPRPGPAPSRRNQADHPPGRGDHMSIGSSTPDPTRRDPPLQESRREGAHRREPHHGRPSGEDSDIVDPREAGQAALQYGGGCLAFTPELRQVVWPDKFRFHVPATYDGTTDPRELLQIYSTAMVAARADDKVMANWFPLAMSDVTRPWAGVRRASGFFSRGPICVGTAGNDESRFH